MSNNSAFTAFYKTTTIPTTHLYQNHIDLLNGVINKFVILEKDFTWQLATKNKRISNIEKIENYLKTYRPTTIDYEIVSKDKTEHLLIHIEHGICLTIKNGGFPLYGLFNSLLESSSFVKVPQFAVFLRKYWLFNLIVSILLIPTVLFAIFANAGWAWFWVAVCAAIVLIGTIVIFDPDTEGNSLADGIDKTDIILPTKIRYGIFSNNVGVPVYLFFTSAKFLISVVTSLATIISFAYLFLR